MGEPCLRSEKQLPKQFEMFTHIIFSSPQFSIGRALSNLFVLPHISISRIHSKFSKQPDESWIIQDLSSFGSLLNRSKMEKGKSYVLKNNDFVQLDPTSEFVYVFSEHCDHKEILCKKRKFDETDDLIVNVIKHTQQKFKDTQNIEVENMESKIRNAKLRSENSIAEREHLENVLQEEIRNLNLKYSREIENLIGEKAEVERQKNNLEEQRILEVNQYEEKIKSKITLLEQTILQQKESEEKLQIENKHLSERLKLERIEFEVLLAEENTSNKEMLNKLETKLQQQEEQRLKEKEQLSIEKKQMEILKAAKEKEVKELEEKMRLIMEARETEIMNLQKEIEKKAVENNEVKLKTEEKFMNKLEEMQSLTKTLKEQVDQIDGIKMEIELLQTEKRKIESKLSENKATSNATVMQLEAELIKVRNELDTVESKRLVLQESLDMTRNQSASADMNNFLERQNVLTEFNQLMESELQCTICVDLLISATTLNCSHTFCKYCIEQWKKKKGECPICRTSITSQCRSLMFDSFINKMVQSLAPDVQEKRQQILKEREKLEQKTKVEEQHSIHNRRRGSSSSSEARFEENYNSDNSYFGGFDSESQHNESSDTWGGSENESENGEEWPSSSESNYERTPHVTTSGSDIDGSTIAAHTSSEEEEEQSRGNSSSSRSQQGNAALASQTIARLPGAYYGGYGRCFTCGAKGHWAPGCPLLL